MLTKKENIQCYWSVFSEWNWFGKIVLAPVMIPALVMITLMELAFCKAPWDRKEE
jgi:hypothetical protein